VDRSLAFIAAHPDDDTFGIGGTISLHRDDPSLRFVLVHATDGDAGDIAPGVDVSREELGAVRRLEDEQSWQVIGRPPDRHDWLGFGDGTLADLPEGVLTARIAAILDTERPQVVATFGPDGITWHPDHIAVSNAATEAFFQVARDGGPGLQRLLHGAIPASVVAGWNERRARRGAPVWEQGRVYHLQGVPDERIGIEVDITSTTERLVQALRAHRTQRSAMPEERELIEMDREWWVIRHPGPHATGRLRDVFEGLE